MSYSLRFRRSTSRQIARWNLPDGVLVDVYLRLREDLAINPAASLIRVSHPFDGMAYTFPVVDRSNRIYGYAFSFHIKYGADEETLWVHPGDYARMQL